MRKPVLIFTNLDRYKGRMIEIGDEDPVPRTGEMVAVRSVFHSTLQSLRMPNQLEVKQVTHGEDMIGVEVHFSAHQLEVFKQCNIRPFE